MRLGDYEYFSAAREAFVHTFAHQGALTSSTNTQRLSSHRLFYNALAEVRLHTSPNTITIKQDR